MTTTSIELSTLVGLKVRSLDPKVAEWKATLKAKEGRR